MPEAVKAVQAYLFDTFGYDFLIVSHYDFNKQSQRVIEKSGFHYIKTICLNTRYGTTENTLVYLLCKEEWENVTT